MYFILQLYRKMCIIYTLDGDKMTRQEEYYIREAITKNIKAYRKANNLNQQQIADIFGFERSTYSSWETGRSMPSTSQLILLARLFNTTVEKLIRYDDGFTLGFGGDNPIYGDKYLSELTDDERIVILKYRLLNNKDKNEVNDYLDSIKEKQPLE